MKRLIWTIGFIFMYGMAQSAAMLPQLFRPGATMFTLKTKYFEFICSAESTNTTLHLSDIADEMFVEYAKRYKLDITNTYWNIKVVVTPDMRTIFGGGKTRPYPLILLSDYSPAFDTVLGKYRDFIDLVFAHELTHIVTLNTRGGLAFPLFMLEGITVNTESETGEGRLNDPAVKETLLQDIEEKKAKTMDQCVGVYDQYPQDVLAYYYGGYFTQYLINKYGTDTYRRLWYKPGDLYEWIGTEGAFLDVLKSSMATEWDGFLNSLKPKYTLSYNREKLTDSLINVRKAVVRKNRIYYIAAYGRSIKYQDLNDGSVTTVLNTEKGLSGFDVSEDGSKMMIYRNYAYGTPFLQSIWEYDIAKGCTIGVPANDFREPRYWGNKKLAVRMRGRITDLTVWSGGETNTLLSGSPKLYFDSPTGLDASNIVFFAQEDGARRLMKLNTVTGALTELRIPGVDLDSMRAVYVEGGKIGFCYNDDQTYYRLGIIEGNTATIQTNRVTGGVFNPMLLPQSERVVYVGRFSSGDSLMSFMPDNQALATVKLPVEETPFRFANLPMQPEPNTNRFQSYNPFAFLAEPAIMPIVFPGLPIYSWQVGLMGLAHDPTMANIVILTAMYNFGYPFADWSLSWMNRGSPIRFSLDISDTFGFGVASSAFSSLIDSGSISVERVVDTLGYYLTNAVRRTQIGMTFSMDNYIPEIGLRVMPGLGVKYLMLTPNDGSNQSPYYWKTKRRMTTVSLALALSTADQPSGFTPGTMLMLNGDYCFEYSAYKTEAMFSTCFQLFIPFRFSIGGGFASDRIFNLNSSSYQAEQTGFVCYNRAGSEFITNGVISDRYAIAEFGFPIYSFEIQHGFIGIMDYYLKRIQFSAGMRGAWFCDKLMSSVYLRATAEQGWGLNLGHFGIDLGAEGFFRIDTKSFGWKLVLELKL